MASLGDAPLTAAQAAKRRSVNPTKVTKAEEAIFSLQPGQDAFARIAAASSPFRPVIEFVQDGVSWRSTRAAMSLQLVFCVAVLHPQYLVPVALCALGVCTMVSKREAGEGKRDDGDSKRKLRLDAKWAQETLEAAATGLERAVAVTTWEDPIVTGAFIASCVALALLCMYIKIQTMILAAGVWLMRPPTWKVVPGPATNLLERMPDKSERTTDSRRGEARGKPQGLSRDGAHRIRFVQERKRRYRGIRYRSRRDAPFRFAPALHLFSPRSRAPRARSGAAIGATPRPRPKQYSPTGTRFFSAL